MLKKSTTEQVTLIEEITVFSQQNKSGHFVHLKLNTVQPIPIHLKSKGTQLLSRQILHAKKQQCTLTKDVTAYFSANKYGHSQHFP